VNNYRTAVSTAVGAAPTVVNNGCAKSFSLGVGVQTMNHGVSASAGIPLGQDKDCLADQAANNMLNSSNETVQMLGVAAHAETHENIRNGLTRIEENIEAMSQEGEEVVLRKGEAHRILGGAFSRLRYKDVVTTVTPPAPAPIHVDVTVEAPCAAAPAKPAAPVARKSAAPKPVVDCKLK
jgi:hypothetical protein